MPVLATTVLAGPSNDVTCPLVLFPLPLESMMDCLLPVMVVAVHGLVDAPIALLVKASLQLQVQLPRLPLMVNAYMFPPLDPLSAMVLARVVPGLAELVHRCSAIPAVAGVYSPNADPLVPQAMLRLLLLQVHPPLNVLECMMVLSDMPRALQLLTAIPQVPAMLRPLDAATAMAPLSVPMLPTPIFLIDIVLVGPLTASVPPSPIATAPKLATLVEMTTFPVLQSALPAQTAALFRIS